jgi:hypothetical protein
VNSHLPLMSVFASAINAFETRFFCFGVSRLMVFALRRFSFSRLVFVFIAIQYTCEGGTLAVQPQTFFKKFSQQAFHETSIVDSMFKVCDFEKKAEKFAFYEGRPQIPSDHWKIVLKLGHSNEVLSDGEISWNNLVYNALLEWNRHVGTFQFEVEVGSVGEGTLGNGVNEVYFSDRDGHGRPLGNALAISTLAWSYRPGGKTNIVETDIVFRSSLHWDSYRDVILWPFERPDIYRVALHEIGHCLGLKHPNEDGQNVMATMNSYYPIYPHLQLDDIQGAQALYPVPLGIKPPNGPLLELRGMAGKRINVFHSTDLHNWRFIDSVFNETTQTNIPVEVGGDYGFFKAVEE